VQVLRRTDADQSVFGNMNLTIFKDDGTGHPGAVAFTHDYLPNYFGVGTWGTTDPGAPAQGGATAGTFGRFVRLERLDNNYWLTFSEFEVIGAKIPLQFTDANDIAIGKPVTSSSPPGYGAQITSGNDGNIDGSFGNGIYRPVFHTSDPGVGQFWQVDLGANTPLDHLQLFARGDNYTTSQFKVTVYKADDVTVAGSFIVDNNPLTGTDQGYDHLINTAGISGEFIRVETTRSEYLAFSELRAFAGPGAPFSPGDYNQDGVVDIRDYNTWKQAFGTATAAADGNGNGIVDAGDYTIWRDHASLGGGAGSLGSVSVPEPPSALLALGLVTLVRRRR
jgi:dockerin type I repeat protein